MTAVATYDDLLVSQPETKTLFMSRRSELRLVKTPRYPRYGASGQKVGEDPGQVIPFRDGVFRCPPTGTVELEDGRKADAAEVLAWLEDHRAIGNIEEGFWRVDPTAPAPSREELQTLTRAAFSLDTEKLERLIEQEEAGWRREDILVIAREAVENIAAAKEEARRQAEEEAAEDAKGKSKG
jgi:hypothetical protein